jgi:hypothetical protein
LLVVDAIALNCPLAGTFEFHHATFHVGAEDYDEFAASTEWGASVEMD